MSVRRVDKGEVIEVITPSGSKWLGEVTSTKPAKVKMIKLISEMERHNLTICIAVPTANRASVMIDKCTEMGVGRIIPIICEKNIVVPKSSSSLAERWERIAMAAAKQSGADVPQIMPILKFSELVKVEGSAIILLPTAKRHLSSILRDTWGSSAAVVIGPELGFTEDEIILAKESGLTPAHLGKNTLRVETAAIACSVMYSTVANSIS